jgi:hypothetical protein
MADVPVTRPTPPGRVMRERPSGPGVVARERALPPGARRRRVIFGLFDAQGWAWATVKAAFWFVFAWATLGYLPDRAYYFTVLQTIDLNAFIGFERVLGLQQPPFFPLVNFCPPSNGPIACPAPPGGMTDWQTSPAELALPQPRRDATALQAGTRMFVAGGRGPDGAPTDTVFVTSRLDIPLTQTGGVPVQTGNLIPWTTGVALPEARADMASTSFLGKLYLIGGAGPDGKPTTTVWVGSPDRSTGDVTAWDAPADLALPAPRWGAVAVTLPTGLMVAGGDDGNGPTNTVFFNRFDSRAAGGGKFTGWVQEPTAMPDARELSTAYVAPGFVFVAGGIGPDGKPSDWVFRMSLTLCPGDPNATCDERDLPGQWATPQTQGGLLPGPRARAAAAFANGTMYVVGGEDANGPVTSVFWAIPETQNQFTKGDLLNGGWQHRPETDLRLARTGAGMAVIGSYAFVVGGAGADQSPTSLERTNLAPAPPFFRLGLIGVTVPGLQIKGEIGQQLGLLAAAGVFTGGFVLLAIFGWIAHHRPQTWAFVSRVTRGRIRDPYATPRR